MRLHLKKPKSWSKQLFKNKILDRLDSSKTNFSYLEKYVIINEDDTVDLVIINPYKQKILHLKEQDELAIHKFMFAIKLEIWNTQ